MAQCYLTLHLIRTSLLSSLFSKRVRIGLINNPLVFVFDRSCPGGPTVQKRLSWTKCQLENKSLSLTFVGIIFVLTIRLTEFSDKIKIVQDQESWFILCAMVSDHPFENGRGSSAQNSHNFRGRYS